MNSCQSFLLIIFQPFTIRDFPSPSYFLKIFNFAIGLYVKPYNNLNLNRVCLVVFSHPVSSDRRKTWFSETMLMFMNLNFGAGLLAIMIPSKPFLHWSVKRRIRSSFVNWFSSWSLYNSWFSNQEHPAEWFRRLFYNLLNHLVLRMYLGQDGSKPHALRLRAASIHRMVEAWFTRI